MMYRKTETPHLSFAKMSSLAAKRSACKAFRVFMALCFCVSVCVPLAGCKDSDVLTELVIDQSSEVDESLDPVPDNTDNATDTEKQDQVNSDADQSDDSDQSDADYGEDDVDQETNQNVTEQTANSGEASEGSEATDNEGNLGNGEENGGDTEVTPDGGGDGDNTEGDGDDDPSKGGPTTPANDPNGDGPSGNAQIYDNKTRTELPESTHIAAAGTYAVIVQMLGGKGALVATDSETRSMLKSSGAFPGETDEVKTGWKNDGDTSSDVQVQKIIDSGADTVLTSSSYGGITQNQAEKLVEAGVDVVEMATIGVNNTRDSDLCDVVEEVGQMLKNAGTAIQYDSVAMADEWKSLHDTTLTNFRSKAGGYAQYVDESGTHKNGIKQGNIYAFVKGEYDTTELASNVYTAYLNAWVKTGEGSRKESSRVRGSAYSYPHVSADDGKNYSLDVSNGLGYLEGKSCLLEVIGGDSSSFYLLEYYFQDAGISWTTSSQFDDGSTESDGSSLKNTSVLANGKVAYEQGETAYFKKISSGSQQKDFAAVGESSYPAVVVRDTAQAEAMQKSANKKDGFYNFGYEYDILVLPSSTVTGSWENGSPESFLSVAWAYCMFRDAGDTADCDSLVSNYYSTFYRAGAADLVRNYGDIYHADCPAS